MTCQVYKTRLQKAREQKGLSQTKLAIIAGLHPSVISNIERGRVLPGPGHRQRLARALEVATEELFGDLPGRIPLVGSDESQ